MSHRDYNALINEAMGLALIFDAEQDESNSEPLAMVLVVDDGNGGAKGVVLFEDGTTLDGGRNLNEAIQIIDGFLFDRALIAQAATN